MRIEGLALCLLFPLASHAFGEPDPSFRPLVFSNEECKGEVGAAPDGTFYVYTEALNSQFLPQGFIYKVQPNGALDASWGIAGRVAALAATRQGAAPMGLSPLPDGSLLTFNWNIAHFTRTGAFDSAYGSQGLAEPAGLPAKYGYEVLGDGSVIMPSVHGLRDAGGNVTPTAAFIRLLPNGTSDASFGNGGYVDIPVGPTPYAWSVMSDGSLQGGSFVQTLAGSQLVTSAQLKRFPAGVADGEAAQAVMPRDGAGSWTSPTVAVDGEGRMYAATVPQRLSIASPSPAPGVELRRYAASGALDTTFARNGVAFLPATMLGGNYSGAVDIKALWQSSTGEWNVAVRSIVYLDVPFVPPTQLEDATRVVRILPDGTPDPAFEQYRKLDDDGAAKITLLADGRIVHATNTSGTPGCTIEVALGDQPAGGKMVEYYGAALDHYFMALEGGETVLLDTTPAGNGWQRTGQAFGAWTPAQLAGTKRLCRFYGDLQAGPNSHFYTPEGSECDSLRALDDSTPKGKAAWRFEGYGANVSIPQGGICTANLSPVYRLYNGAFEKGGVPNHRYTTDPKTYADMKSKGWAGEGVAFCVPPIPNNGTAVYIPGS